MRKTMKKEKFCSKIDFFINSVNKKIVYHNLLITLSLSLSLSSFHYLLSDMIISKIGEIFLL